MKYYKLIDAITVPMQFYIPHTSKSGGKKYELLRLVPGKKYDGYIDDPVFTQALYEAHDKVNYTPELKKALEDAGARFTIPKRTCTCQKQKIDVYFVEVVE